MAELVSQPTSIQSVYSLYRENKLFVNRRYQRKLVWTLEEKQKLIDSILRKYPIPAILIAEKEDSAGAYEIIDGLQRLHAIVSFIETSFSSLDGKIFALQHFPTAKSRADEGFFSPNTSENELSQREVSTLLDYSLALSVMRNASEVEINDVFDRINTYGHRLSDQERRQAGVQNDFSAMVREVACTLRGDVSMDIVPLDKMPSISIDLPKSRHGYEVRADEVFWVRQGVLRSTDLRDSMDEQCVADIAACIVSGDLVERSKDALDDIYTDGTIASDTIANALRVYGSTKISDEIKYCISEIIKVCGNNKLRDVVFEKRTTNAFPSIFAAIVISIHELVLKDSKEICDYRAVKDGLTDLSARIDTGQKATSPAKRRKNINTIKGLISPGFIEAGPSNLATKIYGNHTAIDVESVIRRSEIELPNYELKQGMLRLDGDGNADQFIIDKVIKTICAIANNGPASKGKILIGVTDKDGDAERIRSRDKIEPIPVGRRFVVGVNREAARLGISIEKYVAMWPDGIRNSTLSRGLRDDVLSGLDYNTFYGRGVLIINIPSQKELSYLGDDIFWRNADSTERADNAKQIATIARRF